MLRFGIVTECFDLPRFSQPAIAGVSRFCFGRELPWDPVAKRTVRTLAVVVLAPCLQRLAHIVESAEPACVQALVAEPSVEALHMAVLHGTTPLDMDQADLALLGPAQHLSRSILWPVVRARAQRRAALCDQPIQHPRHASGPQAGIGLQRQTLAGERYPSGQDHSFRRF